MAWLALNGPLGSHGILFECMYAAAYLAMLGIWIWFPDRKGGLLLVLLGVSVRLVFIARFPANDDVFRYLWEGHIQKFGFNPLLNPPDATALSGIRTDYWMRINHKDFASIYFPFAQSLFRAIANISETTIMLKAALAIFDFGAAFLVWKVIRFHRLPRKHVALYVLNPVLIVFTSGEGHSEIVFVFWVLATVYFLLVSRPAWMFLALGFAMMTNLKAWFLAPFFASYGNLKYLPYLLVPVVMAIPYISADSALLTVPLRFATEYHFNGLLHRLLSVVVDPRTAGLGCGVVFIAAWIVIALVTPNVVRALALVSVAFLFCTPTLHPWYLILLTPWLAVYRVPAWNAWHLAVAATFPVYAIFRRTGIWTESLVGWATEYGLVCATYLIPIGIERFRKKVRRDFDSPSLTVIVPVLNESGNIPACLAAIAANGYLPAPEIIIVDGGSTDETLRVTGQSPGVKVLQSQPGRGVQISKGVAEASGSITVVLHADSRLLPGALAMMAQSMVCNPGMVGGAFAARYDDARFKFRIIEWLNNFRSHCLGIAFGDQAQFFRTEIMRTRFPAFLLMEDIELSLRLKEIGKHVHLPIGVLNSTRRWKNRGYMGNGSKVVWLSLVFLIRRRIGLGNGDGSGYYRKYYAKR